MALQTIPVYLLTGFLGSGKTTLLQNWLDHAKAKGLKPAVIMNELGDVNLDGVQLGLSTPMAELLSGCICCTIRGDLGVELIRLAEEHEPDAIWIEATGAANPGEIIEAVTDASMMKRMELKQVVAVADSVSLAEQIAKGKGATFRLIKEQLRCATTILLNKTDLIDKAEADSLEAILKEWNSHARLFRTVNANMDLEQLERSSPSFTESSSPSKEGSNEGSKEAHHHVHAHVMAYTYYLEGPIESDAFERMMSELPSEVYRAKGILSFTDTSSRFLFQYAYRQLDLMKITEPTDVPDVAVFIGEHFDRTAVENKIKQLDKHL